MVDERVDKLGNLWAVPRVGRWVGSKAELKAVLLGSETVAL